MKWINKCLTVKHRTCTMLINWLILKDNLYMIKIHLKNQSQPIVHNNVKNSYEKGSFYCIYLENGKVKKYVINDIFEIEEDYKFEKGE